MRNSSYTSFAAIFWNEFLLNTKRVAPYVLMLLFGANAVLWWGWGPAVALGWATNSDFYIHRNFGGFAIILGLPIFNAIIMGGPVIGDLRLDVYPLIFSKPVGRGSYLLGKFCGNFFVLVCCQSVFAITLFVLQWVPFSGMLTLPIQVVPYFKHFFLIVVLPHLGLAAFYFAVGTLTRNSKIVYVLAACFVPAYIAYYQVLKMLPLSLRVLFDPMGFNVRPEFDPWHTSAEVINRYVVAYPNSAYVNRALMIAISGLYLLIVYFRFTFAERSKRSDETIVLSLSHAPARIPYMLDTDSTLPRLLDSESSHERVSLPQIAPAVHSTLRKILAALVIEFRLLRAERSLIVVAPLAILISIFDLAFYRVVPEVSYSITYATGTANALLLFLIGMTIFYTGEAMHRDRELKIDPLLWATPIPNRVLLLSKWLATVLLTLSVVIVAALTAVFVQLLRGHTPIDLFAYLKTYGLIVLPNIVFMAAFVVGMNVLLRNKYLAYVLEAGAVASLFYLYSMGHNHWLYNPLLYQLWKYSDLTGAMILMQRLYGAALAAGCLALAHLFFERRTSHVYRPFRAARHS